MKILFDINSICLREQPSTYLIGDAFKDLKRFLSEKLTAMTLIFRTD